MRRPSVAESSVSSASSKSRRSSDLLLSMAVVPQQPGVEYGPLLSKRSAVVVPNFAVVDGQVGSPAQTQPSGGGVDSVWESGPSCHTPLEKRRCHCSLVGSATAGGELEAALVRDVRGARGLPTCAIAACFESAAENSWQLKSVVPHMSRGILAAENRGRHRNRRMSPRRSIGRTESTARNRGCRWSERRCDLQRRG